MINSQATATDTDTLEVPVSFDEQSRIDLYDGKAVTSDGHHSGAAAIAHHPPELKIFISTFFTIFLAELGDKTQLTTLLMVAGTRSPWVVFLGAGAALVLTSLLGVLLGRWIASKVSPRTLETSAGAMLLLISVLLLWDVVKL